MASFDCARYRSAALISAPLLLLISLEPAVAQTTSLGYDGDGVFPRHCSMNSQRWFRCNTDPGSDTTVLWSLYLSGPSGGPFNPSNCLQDRGAYTAATSYEPRSDNLDGVARRYPGGRRIIWTIGPYTGGYSFMPLPHQDWCMGIFSETGSSGARFSFTARYRPQSGNDRVDTLRNDYFSHWDDADHLEWYQSPALGVDPLEVTPNQLQPDNDNGAGDSTYKFRVQYSNALPASLTFNLPPRWGADNGVYGESGTYINFDYLPKAAPTVGDAPYAYSFSDYTVDYSWTMHDQVDPWYDETGDYSALTITKGAIPSGYSGYRDYEMRVEGEVVLIIDGNMSRPHLMLREDPNDNVFTDGVIYHYEIQPTDYMNFLDPLFQFRYDPPGYDVQDYLTCGVHGTPTSNSFVSFAPGGHTYEFWATDDWHPPRGVAHVQVGRPGNSTRAEYIHPYGPSYNYAWPWYWVREFQYTREIRPFGYPYDSQLTDRYPDVNPVLSGFPYFPEGGVAPWYPVGGEPRLVPEIYYEVFDGSTRTFSQFPVISPFESVLPEGGPYGPVVGGRAGQPTHYTNDDTIRPNYANIWDENPVDPNATPLRGGKWTNATTFTFLVNYWRKPNRSPDFIRVMIRKNDRGLTPTAWRGFTMEQLNPTDTDYTNGAVFRSQITAAQLPGGGGSGDYNYYFVANDGDRSTIFPNRPPRFRDTVTNFTIDDWDPLLPASNPQADVGVPRTDAGDNDYYWFRVNHPPVLSNNSVDPGSAREGSNFVYRVTYSDVDGEVLNPSGRGDEPFTASIIIDLFGDPEGENRVTSVSPGSINYSTETGTGYAPNSLVNATRPYYVRIEEASTSSAIGLTYQITANDTTTIWATPIPPAAGFGTDPISPGDRFEILQWFTGTMSRTNPSDNTATDGIAYEFNTANLISLGPGLHRYYFIFRDDWGDWAYPDNLDVSVEGERVRFPQSSEFEGPEVLGNTAPTLTNYRFTPDAPSGHDGTTATGFVFSVTYTDMQNDPPAVIRLGIDGTRDAPDIVLDMTPSDPNDDVYSDGAVYQTDPVRLDAGQHIFRAQASDGELTYPPKANPSDPLRFSGPPNPSPPPARLNNVDGPYVAQNTRPRLEFEVQDAPPAAPSPGLDPDAGTEQDTYTYTIIYKDTDVYAGVQGNPPEWVRVYVDGVARAMQPLDPTDTDYTDGATYQTQVTGLVAGTAHTYYFYARDGLDTARQPARTATPNTFPGPRVDQPPDAPKNLTVWDVPNDQGGAIGGSFNPSDDDGGGAMDVTEYRVYYDTADTMPAPTLAETVPASGRGSYSFTHTGAPKATDLWYVVRAYDGTNESVDSNVAGPVRATDNIKPGPPTGLAVTNPGAGGRLDLTWSKSVDDPSAGADDVIEYHIYRATQSMGYTTMLAQVPAGTISHQDTTVSDGTTYYYVVRAFDGENESDNSNEDSEQSTDTEGPVLSGFDPARGEPNAPVDTNISFTATDTGAGVDPNSLDLDITVGGTAVLGSLQTPTPVTDGYRFTFDPAEDFKRLDVVKVSIEISDLAVPVKQTTTAGYRFTVSPPPTYAVSGTITEDDGSGNLSPLADVTVYAGALSATTDALGQYSITGLTNGSYEVRPQKRGYAFVPASRNVSVADADVPGVNFTAVPGYDISGRVTDAAGGVANVRVSNGIKEAVTNAQGSYVIEDSPAGTYVVQPSLAGMVFTPTQRVVTLPDPTGGGGATGVDFTANPETFTVSGTVSTSDGGRLDDALVTATRGGQREASARTDSSGNYMLQGLEGGTYTVAVQKSGFTFEPETLEVTVGPDSINNDFVAFQLFTRTYPSGMGFLAFPVDPVDDDIVAALGTDRVARWDPTRAGVDKYVYAAIEPGSPVLDLAPGRGYFAAFSGTTNVEIPGRLINASDPFSLPLQAGFNMAGNPYPTSLAWANLAITTVGPIADFGFILTPGTRDYELVSDDPFLTDARPDVPPGAGFWIESQRATILTINAPGTASAASGDGAAAAKADGNNWIIPVIAEAPGAADRSSRAGVRELEGAAAGLQVSNPPALSGTVDLYFLGKSGKRLACDIRPAPVAEGVWEFAVSTDIRNAPITVSLPDLSRVPSNMRVTLVDVAANKRMYARTLRGVTYDSGKGGERRFRLEVEPDRGGNLAITTATAQAGRQGVAIAYSVTKAAAMRITVRNLAGRAVATVMRNKDVEAGRNTALWNLQSDRGTKVPAGTYVVELSATAEDGQKVQAVQHVLVGR